MLNGTYWFQKPILDVMILPNMMMRKTMKMIQIILKMKRILSNNNPTTLQFPCVYRVVKLVLKNSSLVVDTIHIVKIAKEIPLVLCAIKMYNFAQECWRPKSCKY